MYKKPINKIIDWIEDKGYTLRFSNQDGVDYENKVITLLKNQKNLIFSALHECGHVIYIGKKDSKDFKILDKGYYSAKFTKTNVYKYKKLQDEMNAWEEGYKLAKQLRIRINKEEYDLYAAKNFNSYVKYLK